MSALPPMSSIPRVTVRRATRSDIPSIQDIARVTWADTYRGIIPEEAQARVLGRAYSAESLSLSIDRSQAFLVAEASRESEGPTALAGYVDVDFDGKQVNLHRLYVLPDYQRMGLGRRLLEEAVSLTARCLSSRTLIVAYVERDNHKARSFYRKVGFVEDDEEIVVIGGVSLPVIRISRPVEVGSVVAEDRSRS